MSIISHSDDLNDLRPRFRAALIFAGIVLFILLVRLWYIQVIRGQYFFEFSRSNTFKSVPIPASRGRILDRNGVIMADNRPSYQALLNRQYVRDSVKTKIALAELLDLTPEEISQSLVKSRGLSFRPTVVRANLNHEQLARIEVNKFFFPGLESSAVPIRNYPFVEGTFHLLGYIGEVNKDELEEFSEKHPDVYKQGDITGKSGIEQFMDVYLKGIDGGEQIAVDALGRRTDDALFLRDLQHQMPVPGSQLVLTIDMDLQNIARDAFQAKGYAGSAIVMNVQDGSLLALYSAPGLDPGMFARGIRHDEWAAIQRDLKKPLIDKSLSGQYPPGSTYKIVTAAAGLELKLITPSERVFCPGYMRFGNRSFRCWKQSGHGSVAFHEAIVQSCDVYFYKLGLKIGVDRLAEYARRFGLGELTGIGINNEQSGLIPDTDWKRRARGDVWHEGETVSISIGQGYDLVTPIQMVRAVAALVNGGHLFKPWMVSKVIDSSTGKTLKTFSGEVVRDLGFEERTRKLIIDGLRGVVQESNGTAYWTRVKEFEHGGKTGTAQVIVLEQNQRRLKVEEMAYLHRDHAWFVAFAPVENPEIAVIALVEHGGHGSTAAAPIVRELLKKYFQKQEVITDSLKPQEEVKAKEFPDVRIEDKKREG